MTEHIEWTPAGHKEAGQPYTPCAIACSYDSSCTAYYDHDILDPNRLNSHCWFGTASTTCTALEPTKSPTKPPRGACAVKLAQQLSAAPCENGVTFGCFSGYEEMYTSGGCRGEFICNGARVSCASMNDANTSCACPKVRAAAPPKGKVMPKGTVMQRPQVLAPGADFQRNFSFAKRAFDDSTWDRTTVPHDALINQTFNRSAGEGAAYLPRRVIWYRKQFALPASFRGHHIALYFQGAFQFAEIYVNGEHVQDHNVGYTTFTVRMDNVSSLVYSDDDDGAGRSNNNILAIRVDPTFGSGHWYEGGGLNRPLSLIVSPLGPRFVANGVFANPNSDGTTLRVSAEIEDLTKSSPSAAAAPRTVVRFTLRDASGAIVATANQTTPHTDRATARWS